VAWSDVESRIKFFGKGAGLDGEPPTVNGEVPYGVAFSPSPNGTGVPPEKAAILEGLKFIYDNSDKARELLETGAGDIWLMKALGQSVSLWATRTAAINLSDAVSLSWMGSDGRFKTDTVGTLVIHELIHAIKGTGDLGLTRRDYNREGFDFLGETVKTANMIFKELAEKGVVPPGYKQVGYDALFALAPAVFSKDISYTEDQSIDIAVFDSGANANPNVLDLSRRTDNSRDLIVGLGGQDQINGGAGRDYLYGGVENDTISGGSGDDVIHGGLLLTDIARDGEDTADYSKGDKQAPPSHGITINVDKSMVFESDKMDGVTPIIVSDDGYGGRDRLFSIEKIKLSKHKDTVTFANDSEGLLASLKEIDAGENPDDEPDILDFSQLTTGISVKNGKLESTGTEFKNFDKILGTAKNDTLDFSNAAVKLEIRGGVGADEIKGSAGADKLFGENDDDTIDGGGDRDEIWGGIGNDTIHGGEGADVIRGGSSVPGEKDTDKTNTLYGDGGNDEIYGDEGNDKLFGGADDDKLSGGAGNDKLFGGTGKDRLTGGAGGDQFYVGYGDIVLDSDSTDKLFVGNDASEDEADYVEVTQPGLVHEFREFSDLNGNYLEGYNHFYLGQDGYGGIFINTGRSLVILGGSGANSDYIIAKDYQTGDFGLDVFDPGKVAAKAKEHYEANKYGYASERFILTPYLDLLRTALALEKQADQPNRAGRSDLLQALDSPTQITGTQDIDFLQGTAGDDEIVGGGEMDLLLGGAGSDIYRYAAGDGDDYIMDYDGDADDIDVLAFDDLTISDIEFSGSGGADLYIDVLGTQKSTITITNQFAEAGLEGIEEIHFADGTVLNRTQILEAVQTVRGTNGNDELQAKSQQVNGEWQPTIFVGGHGNDHLYGGYNGDTYVYAKGDGNDTIQDLADGIGTLRLSDLNPGDIRVSRLPDNSIVVTIDDTGETITVKPYSSQTIGFDHVVFANGAVWDRDDILAATRAPTGATLAGDAVSENAVNGTVVGTVAGVDPDADAVLTYSLTNDAGGRFAIDAATGQITVANAALLDYESAASHSVVVRVTDQGGFKFDKSFTLNVTDVNEAPTGAALTGGSVAENAANGTVVGTVAGFDPDAGAMLTYALTDNAGGRFAIDVNTGQITVANGTLLDYETATSHEIVVRMVDQAGLTFDKAFTIALTDVAGFITGTPGMDVLSGTSENDTLAGGPGQDLLDGRLGHDVYLFSIGDGFDSILDTDGGTVQFGAGISTANVVLNWFGPSGYSISVAGTADGVYVLNMGALPAQKVRFADGTIWDYETMFQMGTTPTSGNDAIYGDGRSDTFDGGAGNDALHGLGGNDILIGGTGADSLDGGAGNDTASYATATTGVTSDLTTPANNTGDASGDTYVDIENLTGSAFADHLKGNENANVIEGGGGNDTLTGAGGNDTFVFNANFGQDTITDFGVGDTIEFRNGFTDFAAIQTGTHQVGDDVHIDIDASNSIVLTNVSLSTLNFSNAFSISVSNHAPTITTLSGGSVAENSLTGTIVGTVSGIDPDAGGELRYSLIDNAEDRFAINATTGLITVDRDWLYGRGWLLDYESAQSHAITVRVTDQGGLTFDKAFTIDVTNVAGPNLTGTSGNDVLFGTEEEDTINGGDGTDSIYGEGGSDTIDGGGGNDSVDGGEGNDVLYGGDGDDRISGGNGDNVIIGGAGNDILRTSGLGHDVFVFSIGDGADYVFAGHAGSVQFGAQILPSDITVNFDGWHTWLRIEGTDDAVGLELPQAWLQEVRFADGTVWDYETVYEKSLMGSSGTASYATATAGVAASLAAPGSNTGDAAGDVYSGIENLTGSGFADTLVGDGNANTINGGAGNDLLIGGAGGDTFVFRSNLGQDIIADFTAGSDILEFRDGIFVDVAAALGAATASGDDTLITIGADNSVLLKNVSLSNLQVGDFHIV
jgi:Ca2+-binding RTX toxin-like protein